MTLTKTKGPIKSRCVQCTALWSNQISRARISLSFLHFAVTSCHLNTTILRLCPHTQRMHYS